VILLATYSGAWGGAERLLVDWAQGLGADVCLACPPGQLADAAAGAGIQVFALPARSLAVRADSRSRIEAVAGLIGHAQELRRLVANLDPELVVAWGMRSAIACTAGPGLPCPVVFHHNDLMPSGMPAALVRHAAGRADLVTAPSRTVADDLDPGRRLGERLVVVHPGVDAARFSAERVEADPPTVLVLGALVPWKRPDLALAASVIVRRSEPRLRLRFVGGPLAQTGEPFVAHLRRRAAEPDLAGVVEFAGALHDAAAELAGAACLLHCAEREPFGLAVLEAMAAGVPVVAPDAAGPLEIADSSCGILYPAGDPEAAARGITKLLSDPQLRRRLGAGGRARAAAHFDAAAARTRWATAVESVGQATGDSQVHRARRRQAEPAAASVVTVTHNSAPFLGPLAHSVQRHLPGTPIVVVDCASTDGTTEVAAGLDSVRLIELGRNLGFGQACNVGVAAVTTPVTVLLNPDVELFDDSLTDLVDQIRAQGGERRLLAPALVGADGRREDNVHPLPASPAELAGAVLPATLLPRGMAGPIAPWRARGPRRVGWAVGAALIARTDTLRRLGPFSQRIFMYGEDLDLGLRAAQAGVETWFCPRSRLLHHRAHSTREAYGEEPFDVLAEARRGAVGQNLGRGGLVVDDLSQRVTFALRVVAKRVLGRNPQRERRQLQALRRARRRGLSAGADTTER
jgi:GT2 family glycosyltransferase/glycosyltransferase involved in cell wall biosynthesis